MSDEQAQPVCYYCGQPGGDVYWITNSKYAAHRTSTDCMAVLKAALQTERERRERAEARLPELMRAARLSDYCSTNLLEWIIEQEQQP